MANCACLSDYLSKIKPGGDTWLYFFHISRAYGGRGGGDVVIVWVPVTYYGKGQTKSNCLRFQWCIGTKKITYGNLSFCLPHTTEIQFLCSVHTSVHLEEIDKETKREIEKREQTHKKRRQVLETMHTLTESELMFPQGRRRSHQWLSHPPHVIATDVLILWRKRKTKVQAALEKQHTHLCKETKANTHTHAHNYAKNTKLQAWPFAHQGHCTITVCKKSHGHDSSGLCDVRYLAVSMAYITPLWEERQNFPKFSGCSCRQRPDPSCLNMLTFLQLQLIPEKTGLLLFFQALRQSI